MKFENIDSDTKAEMLRAARLAGSNPTEDSFWEDVGRELTQLEKQDGELISPRNPRTS